MFQRVQHEIRKNKSNIISAYMDIRNVFEASQIDPVTVEKIEALEGAMSAEQVQKFLLYKRFFKTLISDVRNELKSQVEQHFLTRLRDRLNGTSAEVFSGLDALIQRLDSPNYENIDGFVSKSFKDVDNRRVSESVGAETNIKVNAIAPEVNIGGNAELSNASEIEVEAAYTQLLMRVVGVNQVIDELRTILSALGIKSLYIFLDDYSELPREAMHLLIDALISPLTRWSDFIKFKIAAYPGRVYLGEIDKTKIEEVNLDMYGLYGGAGVAKMEEKATDFVKRLVEKRLAHFCKSLPDIYLNVRADEIWRTLYFASMANPRILGHLLLNAHESHLIYGQKIGIQAVQDGSQKYYEEKVAPFFATGKYRMAFEERSSIYSLKELLESLVSRAREIRQEGSRDTTASRSRPYASHFYVSHDFDDMFRTLELSFFITNYFEQSDRAGVRVSVYALNYGLCIKYQIGFGRPTEKREDRLYFVDRKFDYNSLARTYMLENQEIKCDSCPGEFEISMLPALKMLHMRCPACQKGQCKVVNLSRKYGDLIKSIGPELLLPDSELGILQTLFHENRTMVAAEIAGELDCSGQLVGRRARHLAERSLVTRASAGAVYSYDLTDQAKTAYFNDASSADLDLTLSD